MKAIIRPTDKLTGTIHAPSSKNYTTRYILAACLAEGESIVRYPADADDHKALIRCCRQLGAVIEPAVDEENALRIVGFGRDPVQQTRPLNVGNAGAVLRFLLGACSIMPDVSFETDHADSLGKRPNGDMLDALGQLGVKSKSSDGSLPITLNGGSDLLRGGKVTISGDVSSQYLSGLLFLAPMLPDPVEIKVVNGLKSKPAILQTLEVLEKAGIEIEAADDLLNFRVNASQAYRPGTYTVNGDYPGSSAILSAAAALPGSDITVENLFNDNQGERAILEVLRAMGAEVADDSDGRIRLTAPERLKSVSFDGDRATDAVLAMVGAAGLAEGESHFFNVENLRYKECDRITEPLNELSKLGVLSRETQSEIFITGKPEGYDGGVIVDSRGDHRVIMMLSIVGMRTKRGLTIERAEHISKSYPNFFDDLRALGGNVELIED